MTTELHGDTLEWAAQWIEGSLKGETNARAIEFGRNMAITLRAARLPPQPAPDAEGEWYADRRYVVDKSTTMFRAECKDAATAAKVVSDHALAASVPKLVEAATEALEAFRYMRDKDPQHWDFHVTPEICTAWDKLRAALASAQIQEKQ